MKRKHIDEKDIGYIAGLIDGEGTIHFRSSQRKASRTPTIMIANTNREPLDWLEGKIGGHVYLWHKEEGNHKASYAWQLCTISEVKWLLEQVTDLLKVKRSQAELMLKYMKRHIPYSRREALRNKRGQFNLFPKIPWKEAIYQRMAELNKRGL